MTSSTANEQPIIVWDVDGTLTRSDTLLPFLARVAGRRQLARGVAGVASRVPPGRRWRTAGKSELLHAVLAGRELAAVDQVARSYAADLIERRLRADSVRRWRWHRSSGHRLVLASASPGLYLHHLGAMLGARAVLCTELQAQDGVLTGALATPNCRGAEKTRRIRAYVADQPGGRVWMYSDSFSDLPSLALADVGIRVRPHRRLHTPPGQLDTAPAQPAAGDPTSGMEVTPWL
jgi:phosphatidylglycerophosphatase C